MRFYFEFAMNEVVERFGRLPIDVPPPSEPRIQGKKLADILKASRLLGSAMPSS
jgi:hypothetical protein